MSIAKLGELNEFARSDIINLWKVALPDGVKK
jgi:hypothetical protein